MGNLINWEYREVRIKITKKKFRIEKIGIWSIVLEKFARSEN